MSVDFADEKGRTKKEFFPGDYFEACIRYRSSLKSKKPVFGVAVSTIYKLLIYGPNTLEAEFPENIPSSGVVRFIIPEIPLASSYGTRRILLAPVKNLSYSLTTDSLHLGRQAMLVSFDLLKGCYATSFLREVMKADDLSLIHI